MDAVRVRAAGPLERELAGPLQHGYGALYGRRCLQELRGQRRYVRHILFVLLDARPEADGPARCQGVVRGCIDPVPSRQLLLEAQQLAGLAMQIAQDIKRAFTANSSPYDLEGNCLFWNFGAMELIDGAEYPVRGVVITMTVTLREYIGDRVRTA